MLCQQCSAELPEGSAFCNRCGTAQVDALATSASTAAPRAPLAPAPSDAQARGSRAQPPEEPLWSGRYSLRAAAHLWILSVLWIALVAWLYLRYVETSVEEAEP
jgi:hypothetical protein